MPEMIALWIWMSPLAFVLAPVTVAAWMFAFIRVAVGAHSNVRGNR